MTRFPMVLTMALVPLLAEVAMAQTELPPSGPRVRVTAPAFSGKRLVGVLVGLDETTLTLQRQGDKGSLQVPRAAITKIEASRHPGRKGRGAGMGMLVGLGTAVVVGVATGEDCGSPGGGPGGVSGRRGGGFLCFDKADMALLSGILLVPAATLLGVVASPSEKWEVSTTDRLRIAVAPTRGGGVRAALTIRF
jgi:hypothetical protein